MPSAGASEPRVRFFTPMPKDYQFIPKGDVRPIGLRCPTAIYQEVTAAAQATAATRAAALRSRDSAVEREFEAGLLRLYPKVRRHDIAEILKQALEKRSRRVGRTGTLDLESKVHLAVKAYIRHCHTPYEQLLRDGVERGKARQMVTDKLRDVAHSWMGQRCGTTEYARGGRTNGKRKTRSGQPGNGEREATGRPRLNPTRPHHIKAAESEGNENVWCSAEDSERDALSSFDDDPEDSDWIP
ncbi:hypothetical protein BR93DRAFT_474909 [Coniochaeta sp. PMI_546]|nr:hypothetical protein BR93DRAFT_474909 [Coniochaeta sp. PMI_546]